MAHGQPVCTLGETVSKEDRQPRGPLPKADLWRLHAHDGAKTGAYGCRIKSCFLIHRVSFHTSLVLVPVLHSLGHVQIL